MTEVGPPLGKAKERLAANAVQDWSTCEKRQLVQGHTISTVHSKSRKLGQASTCVVFSRRNRNPSRPRHKYNGEKVRRSSALWPSAANCAASA